MSKKINTLLFALCLFTLVCGCSKENSDTTDFSHAVSDSQSQQEEIASENETKNIILDIPSTADFLYHCSTVAELKEHSDLIIKATVISADAWVDKSATIGTEYTLEVDKCYLGQANDSIIVDNLGGIILASKYFEKQDDPKMNEAVKKMEENPDNSYVRFQFDGAWQPEEGKQYIWFLESYEEKGVIHYNPVNVYEGVYEIDNDMAERYMSEQTDSGITRSSQISDDRMSLSEMENKIGN